jgi:hypothetical protein
MKIEFKNVGLLNQAEIDLSKDLIVLAIQIIQEKHMRIFCLWALQI